MNSCSGRERSVFFSSVVRYYCHFVSSSVVPSISSLQRGRKPEVVVACIRRRLPVFAFPSTRNGPSFLSPAQRGTRKKNARIFLVLFAVIRI